MMQKRFWILLVGVLCLAFCGVAFAENSTLQLGVGYRLMDYKEDMTPPNKSTENGWLPGIYASYEYKKPARLYARAFVDYASGNVTYDGATQSGTPINFSDNNKQVLFNVETDIGYAIKLSNNFMIIPYTGYGYRYWRRGEAKRTAAYSSYREDYDWSYIPVGIKADYRINDKWNLGGTLAAHFMFSGKMTAYFSELTPGRNDPQFDLGSKVGFYADIPLTYRFAANWSAVLTPWYEYSAIGKSDSVPSLLNGVVTGYYYEPASTMHQVGIRLGLARSF